MTDGGPADDCIFCAIVARKAPAWIVYEDAKCLAFLDLFPFTRGHLLVIPKRHVPRLTELPRSEYEEYFHALASVCRRADRLSPDYNVALNQGARAGQIVFHLHFHIIPRYGEPNPFHQSARTRLSDAEARALLRELGDG